MESEKCSWRQLAPTTKSWSNQKSEIGDNWRQLRNLHPLNKVNAATNITTFTGLFPKRCFPHTIKRRIATICEPQQQEHHANRRKQPARSEQSAARTRTTCKRIVERTRKWGKAVVHMVARRWYPNLRGRQEHHANSTEGHKSATRKPNRRTNEEMSQTAFHMTAQRGYSNRKAVVVTCYPWEK